MRLPVAGATKNMFPGKVLVMSKDFDILVKSFPKIGQNRDGVFSIKSDLKG